jgi:hypothetical protein
MKRIFFIGATGTFGHEVTVERITRNFSVPALTRNPDSPLSMGFMEPKQ